MYGGGQFELGPGRRQIQRLASVFYADGAERRRAVRVQRRPGAARARAEPAAAAGRSRFLINLFDDEPRRVRRGARRDALGRHPVRARTRRGVSVSLAVRRGGVPDRRRGATDAAHAGGRARARAVGRRLVRARRGRRAPGAKRHGRARAHRLLLDVLGSGGGRVSGRRRRRLHRRLEPRGPAAGAREGAVSRRDEARELLRSVRSSSLPCDEAGASSIAASPSAKRASAASSIGCSLVRVTSPGAKLWPYHCTGVTRSGSSSSPARRRCVRPTASGRCVQGDVVGFPQGEAGAHTLCNDTDEPVRACDLLDASPRHGRLSGQREAGAGPPHDRRYFRLSDAVDYWDGER